MVIGVVTHIKCITIKISFSNKISPLVNNFLLSNFDIEIGTKLDFRLIVKKAIKNRHQQTLSNDFSISKCLYVSLSIPGEIFQQFGQHILSIFFLINIPDNILCPVKAL
jgi:hypothetical protein